MIVARGYITLTNIQGSANLLDWQSQWREGELPAGWSLNGVAAENSIVGRDNPFGVKSLMWKCTPNAVVTDNGGPAGGLVTPYFKLDDIHTYRYTVFVYREKASKGNIYHGCFGVNNLSGGANTNPYFFIHNTPAGQWYLLVGHIHPSKADSQWQLSASGIYDMTGKKITSGIDYKLQGSNVNVRLRNYLYYTDNYEDIAYFYNPRLEVCDGNEMSIEQLLQVSTRKEIDASKVFFNAEFQKLNDSLRSKVSQTDYNALGERVKKAESEILQTPEAINLAIKNLEIDGENLILNSDNIYNISQKTVENYAFTFNQPDTDGGNKATLVTYQVKAGIFRIGMASSESFIKLKENTTYTYSIWIKPKVGNQVKLGISAMTSDVITLEQGKWSRVKFTTSFNATNKWAIDKSWFFIDVTGVNAGDSFYLYHPQLERGSILTQWKPADSEKTNNIIAAINLSKDGVLIDGKRVNITGELLAQIIKAYSLNVNDRTIIDALGNFKTVNATISGIINALSGTIGNFSIINGDIIGLDTTKKERIRISTNPLPSLDSLTTGYALLDKIFAYTADGRLSADRVSESYYKGADSRITRFTLDGATSLKITGGFFISDTDISAYGRIDVKSPKITIRSLIDTGLYLENVPLDTPISVNYMGVVELKCTTEYYVHCRPGEYTVTDEIHENINLSEVGIYKLGTTEKTYVGSDGFYSVFGSGEYVYFKRGVGFVTKGKTDTGGVLAAGSVLASGMQSNVWGARALNTGATKGGVGVFNVPHKIGHTNYTVTATSHHTSVIVSIISKSANFVQLSTVATNGDAYDIGFDYTIIGQN